eukprot:799439-Pyramimonas_sp.AAC.1
MPARAAGGLGASRARPWPRGPSARRQGQRVSLPRVLPEVRRGARDRLGERVLGQVFLPVKKMRPPTASRSDACAAGTWPIWQSEAMVVGARRQGAQRGHRHM